MPRRRKRGRERPEILGWKPPKSQADFARQMLRLSQAVLELSQRAERAHKKLSKFKRGFVPKSKKDMLRFIDLTLEMDRKALQQWEQVAKQLAFHTKYYELDPSPSPAMPLQKVVELREDNLRLIERKKREIEACIEARQTIQNFGLTHPKSIPILLKLMGRPFKS